MQEELISFETAKLAQEKGFKLDKYLSIDDENPKNLNSNYNPRKYQPWFYDLTQSLLQKWLREKHKINVNGFIFGWGDLTLSNHCKVNFIKTDSWEWFVPTKGKDNLSYEESLEIGLQEALKLI